MSVHLKAALIAAALAAPLALTASADAGDSVLGQVDQTFDLSQIPSGTYETEKNHTALFFEISHFGLSAYIGSFDTLDAKLTFDNADPTLSTVEATIDPASVDTRVTKLNEHLKDADFFDVANFPQATFKSTKVEKTGDTTGKITGDLTLHGVTKQVTLDVTFNGGAPNPFSKQFTLGFSGRTVIKRSDFGISAFLPKVGDTVALRIEAEFAKLP